MHSHYEINVSKLVKAGPAPHYHHLFATSPRSITTLEELDLVYKEIKSKFPEPDYEISVSFYEARRKYIEMTPCKKNTKKAK